MKTLLNTAILGALVATPTVCAADNTRVSGVEAEGDHVAQSDRPAQEGAEPPRRGGQTPQVRNSRRLAVTGKYLLFPVSNRHPSMAVASCFSGSGMVDVDNTAGWQKGNEKTMVIAFTDTGRGESLAYSTDRGKSWTCYEGNPVIEHRGRDPKLMWYGPGKHWVIAGYDERAPYGRNISIYTSKDLKRWGYASSLPGYFECAEILELPADGDPTNKKWVIFAEQKLDDMPLKLKDDKVTFRVLVDRPMFEVVGGGGACFKTSGRRDAGKSLGKISLTARGGSLTVQSFAAHEMTTAWKLK